MTPEQQAIYDEGKSAAFEGENSCPYSGLDAEFWYDGWEDGNEDMGD